MSRRTSDLRLPWCSPRRPRHQMKEELLIWDKSSGKNGGMVREGGREEGRKGPRMKNEAEGSLAISRIDAEQCRPSWML